MMCRWISDVPSQMRSMRASRHTTTAASTTPATRPNTYPTARSASTDASEGSRHSPWQSNRSAADAMAAPRAAK